MGARFTIAPSSTRSLQRLRRHSRTSPRPAAFRPPAGAHQVAAMPAVRAFLPMALSACLAAMTRRPRSRGCFQKSSTGRVGLLGNFEVPPRVDAVDARVLLNERLAV